MRNYLTCVQISIGLVHRNTGHKLVSCLIYEKYNIIFVILKSTQENFCCLVDLIASTERIYDKGEGGRGVSE